ncbi:hypothetical protein Srufu_071340 [Streptomyces libani subsp. rufus]|nr:hypothetical protein Srufu_071340 [Streptomyces libani subsp. rufus]
MNKRLRTGAIATAGVAAVAAAAILLPNANASTDQPAAPKTLSAHSATQLATSLKADLGDQSAGWYLDSSNGHLVMNVLSEDDAASVKAKGAVAKVVHNSMTALKSGAKTLRETAAVPGTAWAIDPKTNKIVVTADRTVTGAKMATLSKATNGMGDGMVTVKRSQGEFKRYDGGDAGSAAGGAGGAGDAAGVPEMPRAARVTPQGVPETRPAARVTRPVAPETAVAVAVPETVDRPPGRSAAVPSSAATHAARWASTSRSRAPRRS